MTVEPDTKMKVDALLDLCRGCFARRNELETLEWKTNLSLWTAIGVSAWALHTRPAAEHLGAWATLYWLALPIHAVVIYRFITQEGRVRDLALHYARKVEQIIQYEPPPQGKSSDLWWYVIELTPTLILVSAAVFLTW